MASWAIDSESIRARGIIIVKYWDCVESLFIVSYKLDIYTSICDIFGLSSYVPPFWLTDFVFNLTARSYPFHSFSTLETTSQTTKRKEKKKEKRHKGLGILVSIRSARPSMRGFGGQLPGVLYLGNDLKFSRNERGICNFKILGVIM